MILKSPQSEKSRHPPTNMDTFGGKIYKIRQKWTQSDENRQNRRKMETIGESEEKIKEKRKNKREILGVNRGKNGKYKEILGEKRENR